MGLFGGSKKKDETVYAKVEQLLEIQAIHSSRDTFSIRIVRIDGCQYLIGLLGGPTSGISTIIHKADCDNPLHQFSEKTVPPKSNQAKAEEKIPTESACKFFDLDTALDTLVSKS